MCVCCGMKVSVFSLEPLGGGCEPRTDPLTRSLESLTLTLTHEPHTKHFHQPCPCMEAPPLRRQSAAHPPTCLPCKLSPLGECPEAGSRRAKSSLQTHLPAASRQQHAASLWPRAWVHTHVSSPGTRSLCRAAPAPFTSAPRPLLLPAATGTPATPPLGIALARARATSSMSRALRPSTLAGRFRRSFSSV